MSKLNLFLSNLSISIITISSFLHPISVTEGQTPQQTFSWMNIFRRKPPREGTIKGARPEKALCLISPEAGSQVIWNTKPFFLWKGDINKIAVGIPGSKEYLKTQIVTGNQSINYTGQPLEPGKTYRWLIFLSELESASPTRFVPFKIMEAPQRNLITGELKRLEILQKSKGADAENIAFAKANYFMEKGLWSDALQQAYSVPNPSPQLSQMIKDLPLQLCESK